jgi:hypothetical protein
MEIGLKRTTIARIAAALGVLCGAIGLLTSVTDIQTPLAPHGWNNGAVLFLLFALFILVDGAVSFEKSRATKH